MLRSEFESKLDRLFKTMDPAVAGVLDRALGEHDLTTGDALELFNANGFEFIASMIVSDLLRKREVGNGVTFVVNRNINFTNVCTVRCAFCAFSRGVGDPDSYLMSEEEVAKRAEEAWRMGATEVCIQGGIHPDLDPSFYARVCRAIKARVPGVHIHAFSPMEIVHGSDRAGVSVRDFLLELKEAGLGSIPGTAAEILDDRLRATLCPSKLSSEAWVNVITTAHGLGLPTTATMMYGHIDRPKQWGEHLALLRSIQRKTGGFTEFVPLSFVHYNAAIYKRGISRSGATGLQDLKVCIVSRLMLGKDVKNIQASWVKLGPKLAQVCLMAGANDLGGTLMNESISKAAGSPFGERSTVEDFVRMIRDAGRVPVQRTTTYSII